MKRVLAILLMVLGLPGPAAPEVTCRINGNQVLLYKVMNWWYTALKTDAMDLCGLTLTLRTKVDAIQGQNRLDLLAPEDWAGQISLFKTCPDCPGPVGLSLVYRDTALFPDPATLPGQLDLLDRIRIRGNADRLAPFLPHLGLEIRGRIAGLLDGRIALHPAGEMIQACPIPNDPAPYPTTLCLIHLPSGRELCRYETIWQLPPPDKAPEQNPGEFSVLLSGPMVCN